MEYPNKVLTPPTIRKRRNELSIENTKFLTRLNLPLEFNVFDIQTQSLP